MRLRRASKLFESYPEFLRFKESLAGLKPPPLDVEALRARAVVLARELEPRRDRSDLEAALYRHDVITDPEDFPRIAPMLLFLADKLFSDASYPVSRELLEEITSYDGPVFYFVGHTSYFDYMLMAGLFHRLGLPPPVNHVAGNINKGRLAGWLSGIRRLELPKSFSTIGHRAYSWFTAALAEVLESQVLYTRTSRYTVRARDGILREPYVPHGLIAAIKTTGKALVVPVAISYSAIPEDRYLAAASLFPNASLLPRHWTYFIPYALGLGKADRFFRALDGAFGEVSVDLGRPFELKHDESLTQQRISHRAIEEVARNKLIHPSHLVAKALQGVDRVDRDTLRELVEKEVENTAAFFQSRYHREPPFHPIIKADLPQAIRRGTKVLAERKAITPSLFHRKFSPRDSSVLQFYGYLADRRIYPLSGRNTMTVVNAGVWGYTLALLIGKNLLKSEELAEHSLVLYDSREDLIEKLTVEGKHPWHFKDIPLPRSVRPEADLRAAVGDTSLVLVVTPSKYFHSTIIRILELAPENSDLVIATKGFIPETGLLPCQTAQAEMERMGKKMRLAFLAGANLAHEIAEGGAGVTQIACENVETFERLRLLLETSRFRAVYSPDVVGSTISAALKNVYAIGYGILEGSKQVPENFLATYSTLATAEIRQFGLLLGAYPETFDAESQVWMADLLATCRGGRSARFGRDLAAMDEKNPKNLPARILLEQYRKKKLAIEGFEASRFAHRMATQRGFHPPILGEIYSILHGGKKVDVDGLIEKCLDVLSHTHTYPAATSIRNRRQR